MTGRNGSGPARKVANRAGAALTGAVRTGLGCGMVMPAARGQPDVQSGRDRRDPTLGVERSRGECDGPVGAASRRDATERDANRHPTSAV